jgi:hypothetical protein
VARGQQPLQVRAPAKREVSGVRSEWKRRGHW